MKRRIAIGVLLALLVIIFASGCSSVGGKSHRVRFVLGDGRSDVVVDVREGSDLYEPAPIDDSFVFAGWFTDPELTQPYLSGGVSADITLYARFLPKGNRVVTFVWGNGDADTELIISGTLAEPENPVREGYIFLGWRDASTGEAYEFGTAPTAASTVLVAEWRASAEGVVLRVHPIGAEPYEIRYAYGATPTAPALGTEVSGWYSDPECKLPFDFDKPMYADADIYQGGGEELSEIANRVAAELLTATVKVHTARYSATLSSVSVGSGVIYALHGGYYYLLTNHHVVTPQDGFGTPSYKVYDSYGNEYNATCMAMDASYDLAVLRFRAGSKELGVASFASGDPAVGETLISIGNPGDVTNSVTYGKLTKYAAVNMSGSQVEAEIGYHTCPIYSGSSGGAVFNTELKLVGINFAAGTDADGRFVVAGFIQRSLVVRFLTESNLVF